MDPVIAAKKGRLNRLWHKNKFALFFLFPWGIGIVVLGLIPMLASLYLSFTDYDMFRAPQWTGIDNYAYMLKDDDRFVKSVMVTAKYVFVGVPLVLVFSLSIAILLSKGIKGLPVFRAVYYIPSLLGGSVAIAILWRQLFGGNGLFNQFLSVFGVEGISWISSPDHALNTLIVLNVWQFGSPMVIFLAGLKQIPKELYEASSIDGANKLQAFLRITLPLLTPIIFFNVVMQLISAFQAFTPAYIIGSGTGGALDSILFYTLYLYQQAFQYFEMGYASGMAWVLLFMIAICTALLFVTSRRWVYYES